MLKQLIFYIDSYIVLTPFNCVVMHNSHKIKFIDKKNLFIYADF